MPKKEDYKIQMKKKEERDKQKVQNGEFETRQKKKRKKKNEEQPGFVQRGVQVIQTSIPCST